MPPTLIILLRELLAEQQYEHISALFHTLATNVTKSAEGYEMLQELGSWHLWGFHLHSLIGVTAEEEQNLTPGMGVHVAVGMMRDAFDMDWEAPQYEEILGYVPQQCIVCDATNATPLHHRLLGNVAYALAACLEGFISFTFPALPPAYPERFNRLLQSRPQSHDHSLLLVPFIYKDSEKKGVFEIYVDPERMDPNRYYTVVDAQYFRQMLHQPKLQLGE